MRTVAKHAVRVVNILVQPVQRAVDTFHCEKVAVLFKSKKTAKVSVGVVIMLVGSTMATHPVSFIPHILWDALAYGLHGYGALPVIKIACHHLNLEDLEEKEQHKHTHKPQDTQAH